jgi:hypothetical protein
MESPDESGVELPTVAGVTTNASSNVSALTSSVIGRPRKDDIWQRQRQRRSVASSDDDSDA